MIDILPTYAHLATRQRRDPPQTSIAPEKFIKPEKPVFLLYIESLSLLLASFPGWRGSGARERKRFAPESATG